MTNNELELWHFGRPAVKGMEALAVRCEELGYDGLTLTDSQNLATDTYVSLAMAARVTSKLLLGPGVTNPLTRHAAVTAGAIASVQELSEGRAVLGIGRGDSSLFNIGHKPVAPAVFERYVADVQTYLRGESLDAAGYDSQLRWLASATAGKVPVDVAATGPKVIAMGARLCERVSFSLGSDPERVAWGIDHVRASVGTELPMPSLGLYVNVCVHDDIEAAAELVRPGVGIFAHFTGMPGATRDRVSTTDQAVFDRLGDYDKARHGSGDAAHAQAMPISFIERFAVIGPAQRCIEKLTALRDLGIDRMVIIGPRQDQFGAEADAAQQRFAQQVIPALKQTPRPKFHSRKA
jgi:5,10-methylenetetrahydromethanopterin reductase